MDYNLDDNSSVDSESRELHNQVQYVDDLKKYGIALISEGRDASNTIRVRAFKNENGQNQLKQREPMSFLQTSTTKVIKQQSEVMPASGLHVN